MSRGGSEAPAAITDNAAKTPRQNRWRAGRAAGWATGFASLAACIGIGLHGQSVTAQPPPPHFLRDIAPILDKKGCSVAACHGKFGGRGGFQVSLLTLSPQDDYDPIVRGARGRRVNLVEPEKSLILLKATGQLGHGGGQRFAVNSREYRLIRDWIAAGAPYDPDTEPKLQELTVTPAETVLPKVGVKQQLHVYAKFTDGLVEDVTPYATYDVSDPGVLTVDQNGAVSGKRWGGAAVVVRYLGVVKSASLVLPRADKTPYPKVAGFNFIDNYVQANLRKMNVAPSRLCTDREFVRRVYLDLTGRLPAPEVADAFVADMTPDKRSKLIDKLLDSPQFVDVRTLRLCDMLRVNPRLLNNSGNAGDRDAALLTEWIHDAVAHNMPYDEFVRDLLTARGSTFRNGAAAFYLVDRTPQDRMETIGQAFLGQRMACARCHKHPFDRWTTDDYWNFAAFMGRVGVRPGPISGEDEVFYNPGGSVVNNSVLGANRGKIAPPTFLGESAPVVLAKDEARGNAAARRYAYTRRGARGMNAYDDGSAGVSEGIDVSRKYAPAAGSVPNGESGDLIERLAAWATAPENPYFAKATVNRIWSHYLGRGIVHPVDDMRVTTPPAVPGLLDALAKDFVAHHYDTRYEIRLILNSRTYQTAAETTTANALDNQFFSHFYPRPMLAQVFLDILDQAAGAPERFDNFPTDYHAVQLSLPVNSYTLDTFGRAHREFLAELEPKVEPTLVQTLHLINSPIIDNKVKNGDTVRTLLRTKASDAEVVNTLYERTLSRPPTAKERDTALRYIQSAPARPEAVQDLMWALISSREFYFVS